MFKVTVHSGRDSKLPQGSGCTSKACNLDSSSSPIRSKQNGKRVLTWTGHLPLEAVSTRKPRRNMSYWKILLNHMHPLP